MASILRSNICRMNVRWKWREKIFPDGALCDDSEMIVIAKNVHTRAFKRAFL